MSRAKSLQVQKEFAIMQGTKNAEVVQLMDMKQKHMVELGWVTEADFRQLNQWHLMSAELVIADLLRRLEKHDA